MAIVARKRKNGEAFYSVNYQEGRQVWQRLNEADGRERERADKRIKKQINAGTFAPAMSSAITVGAFAREWFRKRTCRSSADEERHFDLHVRGRCDWFCSLRLDDVRVSHMLRLIDELGASYDRDGVTCTLAPKSIFNLFGTVRTMFRNARAYELMLRDPCELPDGKDGKGKLSKKPRRKPAPYMAEEVRAIMASPDVAEDERVFCALAFFTGMREGEIAGRRFRDYDPEAAPLGGLIVRTQYDDQPLKTDDETGDAPRAIPVHPKLAKILDAWWREGFERVHCRPPTLDDFIVPVRAFGLDGRRYPWAKGRNHSRSSAYKLFRRVLAKVGIPAHSLHATRHTFITFARRGGARKDVLEKITHNAEGEMIDIYTHVDYDPLCEAMSCLTYEAPANVVRMPVRRAG